MGAAIVLKESQLNAEVLSGHIQTVLSDEEGAAQMATAALTQGKPEAARDLADLVSGLAGE